MNRAFIAIFVIHNLYTVLTTSSLLCLATTNWDIEKKQKKSPFLYPLERALINDILIITNDTSSTRPNNRDFHVQIPPLNYPELARTGRISSQYSISRTRSNFSPDGSPLHYLNLNSSKDRSIGHPFLFHGGNELRGIFVRLHNGKRNSSKDAISMYRIKKRGRKSRVVVLAEQSGKGGRRRAAPRRLEGSRSSLIAI